VNIEDKKIWDIRFASLLHDIGKFWQGAGGKGKHEELSAKFIQQFLPQEIEKGIIFVKGHHDKKQYLREEYYTLKILVLADWLASSERVDLNEEEEKGKRKSMPMESIFSNITLSGTPPNKKYGFCEQASTTRWLQNLPEETGFETFLQPF